MNSASVSDLKKMLEEVRKARMNAIGSDAYWWFWMKERVLMKMLEEMGEVQNG